MPQSFLIIANPIAGGGRARVAAPRLQTALQDLGHQAELFLTNRSGDAEERAGRVESGEFDALVAVGGDGTLNAVLDGCRLPGQRMGQLAMGTANVLAHALRLPRDPHGLAQLLDRGSTVELGVGNANGRRFLLFASAGLDASIVQRVAETRTGRLGKWRWVGPICHVIRHWPESRLRIQVDGEWLSLEPTTIVISRVSSYGGVLRLPREILPTDDTMHVLAFGQRGRWAWAWACVRALFGRLRQDRDLSHLRCRGPIRIETAHGARPAVYQVDGDFGGELPLEIRLETDTVRFCADAAMIRR